MKQYEKIRMLLFMMSGLFVSYFLILHIMKASIFSKVMTLFISSFLLLMLCFVTYQEEKKQRQKSNTIRQIMFVLTLLYLFELISLLFFEHGFGRNGIGSISFSNNVYQTYFKTSFNIIPFRVILFYLVGWIRGTQSFSHVVINLVGNLIFFVPFAFFLPIFFPKYLKTKNFFIFMAIFVFVVELLQMLLLTGSCDIDDWILNVSGAVLGYLLLKKYHIYTKLKKVVG